MKITKKTLIMTLLTIIILPLMGNEALNSYLHIDTIVTILNYLIPGMLCIFLVYDMFKQKKWPKLEFNLFTTLAFWIVLFISLAFSISHQIFNFSNLFKFGCITFILLTLKDIEFEEKDKKTICYTLMGTAAIISIIGILQYFFQISLNTSGIEKYIGALGRINSTTYIATLLDKYLALNIFLVLFFMYRKWTNFYISAGALLLYILALAFTFSRTGLLIFIFLVFVFLILFLMRKQFINAILIIILTVGMYFIPGENFVYSSLAKYLISVGSSISEKINLSFVDKTFNAILSPFVIDIYEYYGSDNTDKGTETDGVKKPIKDKNENLDDDIDEEIDIQLIGNVDYSLSSRSYYKEIAKSLIKEHWTYGIGIGSYTHIYNNQNVNDYLTEANYTSYFRYPHNMYYQLGAEVGLFGLILFFLNIIYMLIRSSLKNRTLMPTILCICVLLVCYTESTFYMKDVAYFTIIVIALLSNDSFIKTRKETN